MRCSCKGVVDYITDRYGYAAEIGIGHFPDVALALIERGVQVFATDIRPFQHNGVNVVVDDVTQPNLSLYAGVQLIYSLRPPPELVAYMERVAAAVSADLIVKPLASEYAGGKLISRANTSFFLWDTT
ncbi:MAG: hypothetical protein DRH10_05910 [Deltaproteobacteria bacterium]|nr:MAG: hypothetical protein DRH10_05910 [Deltaproteobacteria bacterium]